LVRPICLHLLNCNFSLNLLRPHPRS